MATSSEPREHVLAISRRDLGITTSWLSWNREPSHNRFSTLSVKLQAHTASYIEAIDLETEMTTIAKDLSHALFSTSKVKIAKQFALFCGAGLLVSLLLLTYGLDLSPGFF